MLETYLRASFQQIFIEPVVQILHSKLALSANQITILGGVFGAATIPAMAIQWPYLAVVLLILSGYCDVLDGCWARVRDEQSDFGCVLDIVMDRVVEFSVCFALLLVQPEQRAIAIVILLGSILCCVTAFLVIGIFVENNAEKSFHYNPGLIERAEAFIFFGLMMLFPSYFDLLCYSLSGLITLTTIMHLTSFLQHCNANPNNKSIQNI